MPKFQQFDIEEDGDPVQSLMGTVFGTLFGADAPAASAPSTFLTNGQAYQLTVTSTNPNVLLPGSVSGKWLLFGSGPSGITNQYIVTAQWTGPTGNYNTKGSDFTWPFDSVDSVMVTNVSLASTPTHFVPEAPPPPAKLTFPSWAPYAIVAAGGAVLYLAFRK
jgi:hypothetical protein